MDLFDEIDARFSEILQRHGHSLADPDAAEEEKIAETLDILMQLVRPERSAPRSSTFCGAKGRQAEGNHDLVAPPGLRSLRRGNLDGLVRR